MDETNTAMGFLDMTLKVMKDNREDIQTFFSSANGGEGEKIRNIYRQVRMNVFYGTKKIPVRDVNFAIRSYMDEYYPGLLKFTTEALTSNKDDLDGKSKTIVEKLDQATHNDKDFINSLFEDSRNPINGMETLRDAMKSLEALIDFLDSITKIEEDTKGLEGLIKDNDSELACKVTSLFYNSVHAFTDLVISLVKQIFFDIEAAVTGNSARTAKEPVEATPDNKPLAPALCD